MSLFENYNADDMPEENTGKKAKVIRIKDEPIIAKLVPILNMKDGNGKPLLYYSYGRFSFPVKKDGKFVGNYTRPSLKVQGLNDPQFDKYLELKKQLKEVEKSSGKESQAYVSLEKTVKSLAPTSKAIIFVHVLGTNEIQAMEIPDTLRKKLFGSDAWGDKPAEEGMYQSLRRKELNLFNVMGDNNWLKFSRTGTTWNDTKYHVELYKTPRVVDGEEGYFTFKHPVSDGLSILKDSDLPVATIIAAEYSWSEEEVVTYLNTGAIPSRITEGRKNEEQTGGVSKTSQGTVVQENTVPTTVKTSVQERPVPSEASFGDSLDEVFR